MNPRPNCLKCGQALTGPVELDLTHCPHCGKRWLLTADHTQIAGTTLVVHPGQHSPQARLPGEQRNG